MKKKSKSKIEITCIECGKKKIVWKCELKYGRKFCSQKCYHEHPKSEELKEKISKAFSGSKHPRWKGGVTKGRKDRNLSVYKNWRSEVFKRDRFTCQICGEKNRKGLGKSLRLEAHHIYSYKDYPEMRYNVNNGLTLCETCHDLTRFKEVRDDINFTLRAYYDAEFLGISIEDSK